MKQIKDLNDIDTKTAEGRLLLSALAKLTTESQSDKTPVQVIAQCNTLLEYMFIDDAIIDMNGEGK